MEEEKKEGLPFDRKSLDIVNANLLISVSAMQSVCLEILRKHLEIPDLEMKKEIETLYNQKKSDILSHLYTQYGMTPDVLLRPDDL